MNRLILRMSLICFLTLWAISSEVDAERRRKKNRNRNNRRRNNDYIDNNEDDESLLGQFSGDSYAEFMERYYGGSNGGKSEILGSTYIDQEDDTSNLEGSGAYSDDEDYGDIEGSGQPLEPVNGLLPEQFPSTPVTTTNRVITTQSAKTWTTPTIKATTQTTATTTTTTIASTTTRKTTESSIPSSTPFDTYTDYLDFTEDTEYDEEHDKKDNIGRFGNYDESVTDTNEGYEGSGADVIPTGSGDKEGCQDDDEDCERNYWSPSITPETASVPTDTTSSTPGWQIPSMIDETIPTNNIETQQPGKADDIDLYYDETNENDETDNDYNGETNPSETEPTKVIISETETKILFGPSDEDVSTFFYDNKILVIAVYSSLVFLLVSTILVVGIVVGVKHCRKKYGFVRVSGEDGSSTDSTTSSDLPIIKKRNMMIQHKPSSGMMTAGLGESGVVRYDDASNRSHYAGGRNGSFTPITHALPDLSLPPDDYKSEKPSKFLDLFKRKDEKSQQGHLNRSNNLNSSNRSSKKFEKNNHRDWL